MFNIANVIKRFSQLSGLSESQINSWIYICEDSILEIKSQLRDGVSEQENTEKLNSAAAALSFYKYVLCTSIKDDLDPENQYISNPYTKSLASDLWQKHRDNISNLLKDEKFIFKAV
jgi:hypothetical protein